MAVHVQERLQQRTSTVEQERAFELLRDHRSLAAFIARLARLRTELATAERVALPLGASETPAHLVVTREGKGVTCLAPGMAFSVPALRFAQVEWFLARRAERLRRKRALNLLEERPASLERSVSKAFELTRSEFDVLRAMKPLMEKEDNRAILDLLARLSQALDGAGRRRPFASANAAEAAWRLYTGAGVSLMAGGVTERTFPGILAAQALGDGYLAPRATWLLANHAEDTMKVCLAYNPDATPNVRSHMRLNLLLVGHRCSWLEERALDTLAQLDGELPRVEREKRTVEARGFMRDDRMSLLGFLRTLLRVFWDPDDDRDLAPVRQRFLDAVDAGERAPDVLAGLLAPRLGALVREWQPFRDCAKAPLLHPLHLPAQSAEERQRVVHWHRVGHSLTVPTPMRSVGQLAFWTAAPMDAFIPLDDEGDTLLGLREGGDFMQEVLRQVVDVRSAPRAPVRNEGPAVGRNDPCTCGSGKKFKKCCGAA